VVKWELKHTTVHESSVCKALAVEQLSPRRVGPTLVHEVAVPRLGLAIGEAGATPPEEADPAIAEAVEEAERPVALVVRVVRFVQTVAVASNPGISGHPRVGRGLARELRLLGWEGVGVGGSGFSLLLASYVSRVEEYEGTRLTFSAISAE
jgi:hypothetical protein